jgi:hypothetical protein
MHYHTRSLEKKGFPMVIFLTRLPACIAGRIIHTPATSSPLGPERVGRTGGGKKPEEEYHGSFNEGVA